MESEAQQAPKAFISYSHDSPEHKRWVAELATKLLENGIEVILDQWDLGLGDDVPKFMERSVTDADRVLMICTDKYVHKANEGSGGVGYEAMIVTGELVQNLGTSKFIPVIRQNSEQPLVPRSVSTRLYVNLSDPANYEQEFERLLKELHNVPSMTKPPLGKSPYLTIATADTSKSEIDSFKAMGAAVTDLEKTYGLALELIRKDDMIGWRTIIRDARKPISEALIKWRGKYEGLGLASRRTDTDDTANLMESAADGIAIFSPLFTIALAGVVSGKAKFKNQIAILDDVLYPKNWFRSGSTDIVYLPESAAFVYQALHGAACIHTEQLDLAVRLARERIGEGALGKPSVPLYKTSEIVGYPYTLGGNSRIGWDFLWQLPERWAWLVQIYGDVEDYRVALCAYYMTLNIVEFVDTLADGHTNLIEKGDFHLEVPYRVPAMPGEIVRRAYRLLLRNPEQIRDIWRTKKVSEDDMKKYWIRWISVTARLLRNEYPFVTVHMIQENLIDDLS